MRTLVDFATNDTLLHLSGIVRDSLQKTKDFWQIPESSSKLLPLLEITSTSSNYSLKLTALDNLQISTRRHTTIVSEILLPCTSGPHFSLMFLPQLDIRMDAVLLLFFKR